MTDHSAIVRTIDAMYEVAVTSPDTWSAEAAVEWVADAAGSPSKDVAKQLRQAIRLSVKLAEFWRDPPATLPEDAGDWRTRVDLVLGARAWRPVLEVARAGLGEAPSEELYQEVKDRFRLVHNSFWMEGVTYDEWREKEQP